MKETLTMLRPMRSAILTAAFTAMIASGIEPLLASAGATGPPIYPGAVPATRPSGVAFKAPPSQAKTYVTEDSFAKVKSWYQAHLKGAPELQQPGMQKTEDAFLVGKADSGMVVMVESYKGKTWIVIGPPM
jgi:hypothetical protein